MPLYDYKCTGCGTTREVRHGFNESYGDPCAACGAAMRRVFNPAPIVFKGSGFYVTDSRPADKKSDAPKSDAPKSESTKSESTKSESKPESKGESAA